MSDVSERRLRLHVLASATAIAITSMCAPAMAAGRVDVSGLHSPEQKTFDRFIVKYRDGSSERSSAAALDRSLRSASSAIPAKSSRALAVTPLRQWLSWNALAAPATGMRCAFAIGLRTLTLQTGRSFQNDLGLGEEQLAIQVGGAASRAL